MAQAGFALRVDDPDFVRRTRVLPFVHGPSGMPLDVVLAGSGLEDEFIERAVPTEIDGTSVPVIHLDDLIVAKVLAGRPKDLQDAHALWRLHGARIDSARVRHTLTLHVASPPGSAIVTPSSRWRRCASGIRRRSIVGAPAAQCALCLCVSLLG